MNKKSQSVYSKVKYDFVKLLLCYICKCDLLGAAVKMFENCG